LGFTFDALDGCEHEFGDLAQLHFSWMEPPEFSLRVERGLGRHQLENVDAAQGPTVPPCDKLQLAFCLRQGNVKHALALARAFEQELKRDGGFACARTAFVKIEAIPIEAAAEDVV
jgi:hypothetical protein